MKPTHGAELVMSVLYKEFLSRQKNGFSRSDAVKFESAEILQSTLFSDRPLQDIEPAIDELKSLNYVKTNILGNIFLTDKSISIMENRFKNGLVEVLDFVSKFI